MLFLAPTQVQAVLKVQPRLDLRSEYNDNLFLEANREQGDQISTLAPGIRLDYQVPLLNFGADYSLRFIKYNKRSDLDETRLRDVQRASLLADLFPGRDFTLHIADTLSRVSLDERRAVAEGNDFFNKSNLNDLRVNPSYTFRKIQHFSATLGYLYDRKDYEASEGDDSESHAGTLELSRDISAGLSLLAGTSQRFHRTELSEDYDRQDYYGGLRLKLSPRVSLHGRAGQARIQFDGRPDTSSVLLSLGIDYAYSPQLSIRGLASQDYSDSATEGLYRSRALSGTLAYQGKVTVDLSALTQTSDYETDDREDRSAGIRLALGIPMGPRTSLGLGGDITYYNFRPENEEAYRYGSNVSLSYTYGIIFLRASYIHRVNDSTFAFNDYRNNIVAGEIGLHF
jgi:uncharacterized protein (PEP-CTERM system associated)